jgi:hypothetical protein
MSNYENFVLVKEKLIDWGKEHFKCEPTTTVPNTNNEYSRAIDISAGELINNTNDIIELFKQYVVETEEACPDIKDKKITGFNFDLELSEPDKKTLLLRMYLLH